MIRSLTPRNPGSDRNRTGLVGRWALLALVVAIMPAAARADEAQGPENNRHADIREREFYSLSLGKTMRFLVVPPPPSMQKQERYPLLLLLHGLGAKPSDWIDKARIHDLLGQAMMDGHLPPAYTVIPDGEDGYWTNWTDGKHRYGDYVAHDLMNEVRRILPVDTCSEKVAIAGISMGGFGALSLCLGHPQVCGTAIALSPTDMAMAIADQPDRLLYRKVFGSPHDQARVRAVNPRHQVLAGRGKGQNFILVVGTGEPRKFLSGTKRLFAAMKARGIETALRLVEKGTHSFDTTWAEATHRWWIGKLAEKWAK